MKKFLFSTPLMIAVIASTVLVGCQKKSDKNISNATGWRINSKDGGFPIQHRL